MRLFKRSINPIFIEDDTHMWQKKRGGVWKWLILVLVIAGIGLAVYGYGL